MIANTTAPDTFAFRPRQYWYDPKRGVAWEYDGKYGGDGQDLILLTNTDDMMPIFDVLPRLWDAGYVTKPQDGSWYLFRSDGEGIVSGATFRDLCVNILLSGV